MKTNCNKNISGLTLIEIVIVVSIFSIFIMGIYSALSQGQSSWFEIDNSIEIQQNLRKALERISPELQESGFDKNNVWQVAIFDGAGINGTDTLRFSIPIVCEDGANILDVNGDIAYWGASLTWGCLDPNCMDADNDCTTLDYKYISYLIDDNNHLIRRALDPAGTTVREDIFAQDITDLQISSSPDNNIIVIDVTSQRVSALNRLQTVSDSIQIYLRNRG